MNASKSPVLFGMAMVSMGASALGQITEAESGVLKGADIAEHASASGGARVRNLDAAGDSIVLTTIPGGDFLRIRYSLGLKTHKVGSLLVAGAPPKRLVFQPTGGWQYYADLFVPGQTPARVSLALTAEDVRANRNKSSAAIDCVEVVNGTPPVIADEPEIRKRVMGSLLATDASAAKDHLGALRADGTWPDMRYDRYPGSGHLSRVLLLAAASRQVEPSARGPYTTAALSALGHWLEKDYRHSNWWVNDVPAPRILGGILLLLGEDLPDEFVPQALVLMRLGWPPPPGGKGTGANLFYRVDAGVRLALFLKDPGYLNSVFVRAGDEIKVTTGEGLQVDFSFLQHGPQFYAASYGMEYTRYGASLAKLGDQTAFALPPERIDLLSGFILDCQQWITRGDMMDPGAMGRAFTRAGSRSMGRGLLAPCNTMAGLDIPRAAEFARMARRFGDPKDMPPELEGNRCFWRADFMVHRRQSYYVSLKMASTRTLGTEGGNGEGLKNYHLPDGSTFILRRGDEYRDIQPTWNWRRVPGITCEQDDDRFPRIDWGRNTRGKTAFAGGVSDGHLGVGAHDFDKKRVKARKAWFFFDREVVCLGAAITCSGEAPVYTTLNQSLLNGPVTAGDQTGPARELDAEAVLQSPCWVHHDGVGYAVLGAPGANRVGVRAAEQRGTWKSITNGGSVAEVAKPVFTAWVDHGRGPTDSGYAYFILPDASAADIARYALDSPVVILADNAALQAVRHRMSEVVGAAFHEPGRIEWDGGQALDADTPCVVLLRPVAGGLRVGVANPAYELGETVTISLTLSGNWRAVALPEGTELRPGDGNTTIAVSRDDGASVLVDLSRTAR